MVMFKLCRRVSLVQYRHEIWQWFVDFKKLGGHFIPKMSVGRVT